MWRMCTFLTIAVAAVLALTVAGSARADIESERFRLPSGNIACGFAGDYVDALGRVNPPSLRCDILGGLKPRPSRLARPVSCDLDWGDSVTLSPTGRTELTCHGDTVFDPRAKVLPYSTTWTRGPFTCTSRTTGLTCKNRPAMASP
jgi:hypothetical protein